MEVLYCVGPGHDGEPCGREVAGHGKELCSTHLKQDQRTGRLTPIAEKVSAKEHMLNLLNRWAEAESDQEYETAERAVLTHAKEMGKSSLTPSDVTDLVKKARSEVARRIAARAKAQSRPFGRPPANVDPVEVLRLMEIIKRPQAVAAVLRVSRATIYRILRRLPSATNSPQGAQHPISGSPRSGGGC